jgi:hypothetical protein
VPCFTSAQAQLLPGAKNEIPEREWNLVGGRPLPQAAIRRLVVYKIYIGKLAENFRGRRWKSLESSVRSERARSLEIFSEVPSAAVGR